MRPPPANKAGTNSTYIQAIPIYLGSDTEIVRYFRDYTAEIDAITGTNIAILMPAEIRASDAAGVAAALGAQPNPSRFAGLGIGDLPCLWLEDQFNRSAILKLPHDLPEISQTLKILAEICAHTKDAPEVKKQAEQRLQADAIERRPFFRALQKEIAMSKSSERLIALVCGVVFVSIILVIALFIPQPSAFQYTTFRIVLALAAGGFVSMTPGFIEAQVGTVIRAGGALAVFAVVYFYAPAALQALK